MPKHTFDTKAIKKAKRKPLTIFVDPNDVTTWVGQRAYYRDHLDEYGIRVITSVKQSQKFSRVRERPIFKITWDASVDYDKYCLVQRHGGNPYCEIGEKNCCDVVLAESEE